MKISVGVDIGGTHITSVLIDLDKRSIIPASVKRATVNASGTKEEIIRSWATSIMETKGNEKIESICFAMPGPFDYEEGISQIQGQDKYENLYGVNVKEMLATQLSFPKQSIFMTNDAACFLQGEVFAGAAKDYENSTVIGITLGTGLGSAVYRNGESYNADMWCSPFKESIAEDYISTRWFVKRWNRMSESAISGVKELTMMPATDERVNEIFNVFANNLSDFLLKFIEKEKPSAIVIGGNISKAYDRFASQVAATIKSQQPEIKIQCASLGEDAQLLGAVSCWLHQQKASRV